MGARIAPVHLMLWQTIREWGLALGVDLVVWAQLLLGAAVVVSAELLVHRLLRPVVLRVVRFSRLATAMLEQMDRPLRVAIPLLALTLLSQGVPDTVMGIASVQHLLGVLSIAALTAVALAAVRGVVLGMTLLHPADVADNLNARRIQTQARVLARIASSAVLLTGLAFILMTFPRARQLGASLLASAGLVGLVVGVAARPVFGNLIAGLQLALAQPLRLDDVLIVKGEWGRVEEITSTYVVLKLWDQRRLIVPLQWFIENPFENWTRTSSSILGTVMLWVDYLLPVAPLRQRVRELCEASPHWDGRVCSVQVTDSTQQAMQLRVLVSSRDSGRNFDLRCELREALIAHIRTAYPQALPRLRLVEEAAVSAEPPST